MDKTYFTISESEWRVMKVLWQKTPQTLAQIKEALGGLNWTTTTIQTYLARLVKKGVLDTQRQGKGYLYSPTVSEEACQLKESKNFLGRIYGGSISNMVLGFIKSGNLSDEELMKLKDLIEKAGK
jgi:BlaI family penicillinase repressor